MYIKINTYFFVCVKMFAEQVKKITAEKKSIELSPAVKISLLISKAHMNLVWVIQYDMLHEITFLRSCLFSH